MKKLLLTIFAVLLVLCMALCAACSCGSNNPDGDNGGTTGPGTTTPGGDTDGDNYIKEENGRLDTSAGETIGEKEEEKVESSLTLETEAVNLVVGNQKTVTVSYTKIDGNVLSFVSSDTSIATVDESGVVTAMKPGTAIVTVSYGDKSATCAVNVSLGGAQPSIAFDFDAEQTVSVNMGQSFDFKGYISFNGGSYDDATFTYVIDNAEAGSIDEDGIFTPAEANKTATVTVTAEWRGIQGQLVQTFNLTTKAAKFILVNDGQTNLVELYTVAKHGGVAYATSSPFVVKAYDGDVSADNEISEISVTVIENDGVVEWDETSKTMTALKAGEATFKVTVGSGNDAFEKLYTVKVKKPLADYTETIEKFSTLYGYTANGSLAEAMGMDGEVVEAYQDGEALSVIDGCVFGVNCIDPWDVSTVTDLTVYNDKVGYNVKNLKAYYAVITDSAELVKFMQSDIPESAITKNGYSTPTVDAPVIYGGYTILDADIDMSGITLDTRFAYEYNSSATETKTVYFHRGNMAFKGTFDGQGHIIDGLAFTNNSQYGVIGLMYNGVVKNVGLTNVSLTSLSNSQYYVAALCGGIAGNYTAASAEVTNVYVQVSSASDDKGGANGCSIIAGGSYNYAFNIHDCVFEYPTVTVLPTYVGGPLFGGNRFAFPKMNNVYLVTGTEFVTHHYGWSTNPEDMYMMLAKRDTDKYTEYGTKVYSSSTGQLRRVVLDSEADAYKNFVKTISNFDAYYSYRHLSQSTDSESFTNFDTRYWTIANGIAVFKGVSLTGGTAIREGTEITVEPTEALQLHLDTTNVTDAIAWTSGNENVATITDDGKVTINTTGDVTFTATVGSEVKEILVHVAFAETPIIQVDAIVGGIVSVVNGASRDLLPYVTYNGNTYNGLTYTYAWENTSLELGSIDDGVFNSNGTKGKNVLTVTTNWYGNTFMLNFYVSVSGEYVFTLNGEDGTAFIFDEIALDTVAEHEGTAYTNQRDFVLVTTVDGKEVTPVITYSEVGIVSIADGKITAVGAGDVTVKITIDDEGVEISKYVTVEVTKPVHELTEAIDMYSAHDGGYYNGTDFTTLKQWFADSGKNFVATFGVQTIGDESTALTVTDGNVYGLTIKGNTATFTVYDDKVGYTVTINGYDRIIADVEDFVEFFGAPSQEWLYENGGAAYNASNKLTFSYPFQVIEGSFALVNDLDMTGTTLNLTVSINKAYDTEHGGKYEALGLTGTYTWLTAYRVFANSTFDGLGHTVSNLYLNTGSHGGLFGSVGSYDTSAVVDGMWKGFYADYNIDATAAGLEKGNVGSLDLLPGDPSRIKNIAFADVTYGSKSNEVLIAKKYGYYAGLENVYVQITGEIHDRQAAIGMSQNVGVFKNVVVEFPEGPEVTMGGDLYGYGPMVRDGSNAIYFVQGNKEKCCIENFVFITKTPALGGYYQGNRVYVAQNETNKDITDNGAATAFAAYEYTGNNEAIKNATGKLYVPGTYRYDDYAAMIKAVEDGELSLDKFTTDNAYWTIYQNKLVWAGRLDAEKDLLASQAYITVDGEKAEATEIFTKEDGITVKDTATIAVVSDRVAATDVTFVSDSTDVATVDENGVVSAVATGKAVITATFKVDGVEKSLDVNVTVSEFSTAVLQSLKLYVNDVETDQIVLDDLGGEVTDNNTAVIKVISEEYAEYIKDVTLTSSDATVATASIKDGVLTVTALKETSSPVTVTYAFTVSGKACSVEFTVTVNPAYSVLREYDYSCMHGFTADYITDNLGGDGVKIVSVVDKASGEEYYADGKCTLTNTTNGLLQQTVIVRTDTKVDGICVYEIPLNVYSGIISTAEEFLNFARVSYTVEVVQHATYTEDGKTVSIDSETIYLTVSGYGNEAGAIKDYADEFKLKDYMTKTDFTRLSDTYKVTTCTLGGANTGCYILTDDIDLTGTTLAHYSGNAYLYVKDMTGDVTDDSGYELRTPVNCRSVDLLTFSGVFDGQGHTVKGLTINHDSSGLFGDMVGATVKNVAFDNVNITINSTGYAMAYGVIADKMDANSTIENVYLNLESWGTSAASEGNRMFALLALYQYGHLKNVIVETPELAEMPQNYGNGAIGFGQKPAGGSGASAENVVVISKNEWIANYKTDRLTVAENDAEITTVGGTDVSSFKEFYVLSGIYRYDDVYAFAQSDYDMSGFDNDYWDVSTGVAVWKGLFAEVGNWRDNADASTVLTVEGEAMTSDGVAINLDESVTVKFSNDIVDVTDFAATVSDTSYATVTVDAQTLTVKISGIECTLNTSVVCTVSYKIGGKAYTRQFNVSVSNLLETANLSAETGLLDNTTRNVWENEGYAIKSAVLKNDTATELYDSESGKITLTNDTNDLITLHIYLTVQKAGAEDIVYEIPVNVYTQFIDSAEKFLDIFAKPEYYMTLTQQYQAADGTIREVKRDSRTDEMVENENAKDWSIFVDDTKEGETRLADKDIVLTQKSIEGAFLLNCDIDLSLYNTYSSTEINGVKYVTQITPVMDRYGYGNLKWQAWYGDTYKGQNFYGYAGTHTFYFDGDGHTISNFNETVQKFTLDENGAVTKVTYGICDRGGLFGNLTDSTIKNLSVTSASMTGYQINVGSTLVLDDDNKLTVTLGSGDAVDTSSVTNQTIMAYNVNNTLFENLYVEVDNPAYNRNGGMFYVGYDVTLKDVVIKSGSVDKFNAGYGYGPISICEYNETITYDNVVVISEYKPLGYYNKGRLWLAENDKDVTEITIGDTVLNDKFIVKQGVNRYDDFAAAVAAGKTTIGDMTITSDGVTRND